MDKIKGRIRVPTEQFAYLEIDFEGTPQEMINMHDWFIKEVNKEGLGLRDWAKARNDYILKNEIDEVDFQNMSKEQKNVINQVKIATRDFNNNKE